MRVRLQFLYDTGKIGINQLNNAVAKGWITEEEKEQIING